MLVEAEGVMDIIVGVKTTVDLLKDSSELTFRAAVGSSVSSILTVTMAENWVRLA